jgi:transposase
VRQRTQCINAIRGHLAEYGHVAPKGTTQIEALIDYIRDPASTLPDSARSVLQVLIATLTSLNESIVVLDAEITRRAKDDPIIRRLTSIPGIGPITAAAISALAPQPEAFQRARDFSAWLGLTPTQKSSGGKTRLGATSKMGERTIRRLLIIGASAVVRQASRANSPTTSWLSQLLTRKPPMLAIVAVANKTARIVWARLTKGGLYKAPAAAA